ncbi:ribosomal RNA processing protein 1 homolog A [Denticeps clupeoides]|uniref:Uncharacterized protein n=1 Tax=Denticeps clupeoides TaxID=299321 RepID=A0AAY4BY44_9TELE|nr:ribosomal RNA processing protein 1 homolog A-like [Denticeps clupeoides]
MAPIVQEAEIVLAQRLASNEKRVRNKAIRKLRNYLKLRSQRPDGGFGVDELLKIWKGLFYCLWMQDKPLLQEELSESIAALIHNFHTADMQLLYFEAFLHTFKREWNGIDRLRMDKFYQLVRFVFRQVFEMLKRRDWDSSVVSKFLQLLSSQLLNGSAPSGLLLHVLDLYLAELARIGALQLTADQNLTFIDPFCCTAVKTRDHVLLQSICTGVFGLIVDHAPFAIGSIMNEIKDGGVDCSSDSGQASEEESQMDCAPEHKLVNGTDSEEADYNDDDDSLEMSDEPEVPEDEDIGPVLQFDYGMLAKRLFDLACRVNTPSYNRNKLYRMVKILRDLSEGVFPQDEGPEEVSTDEDDDDFASRKRIKKKRRQHGQEQSEEEDFPTKLKKAKDAGILTEPPADQILEKRKKRRRSVKGIGSTGTNTPKQETMPEPTKNQPQLKFGESQESDEVHCSEQFVLEETPPCSLKKTKKQKKQRAAVGTDIEMIEADGADPTCPDGTLSCDSVDTDQKQASLESDGKQLKITKKKQKRQLQQINEQQVDQVQQKRRSGQMTEEQLESFESTDTANKVKKKQKSTLIKPLPANTNTDTATHLRPSRRKQAKAANNDSSMATEENEGPTQMNGCRKKQTKVGVKKRKLSKRQQETGSEFISFQSGPKAPTPLYCKTKLGVKAQKYVGKKVTFGLKNNKTAEFRRMDRSCVLSPSGEARVPFDPEQKPKCGVLKSPVTPKRKCATLRRATAADFF